jgi:hypothetical protein
MLFRFASSRLVLCEFGTFHKLIEMTEIETPDGTP